MAFMVKHVVGGQLKNLTGGLTEEKSEGEKTEAAAQGMTQEEFEQYQQQLEEEKQEREANFAQKKAERATVRTHFREKYRLPKNELDETQIQQAGDDVVLPTELAKMIAEDNQEEAHKQSMLGQLSNIQNVDIDQLKDKAQATLEDLKKQTENCNLISFIPCIPAPLRSLYLASDNTMQFCSRAYLVSLVGQGGSSKINASLSERGRGVVEKCSSDRETLQPEAGQRRA
ncbi:hypothetical protein CCH79_00006193 [Gambusia affinis]|uniref:Complexin 3b n=1 Tax=Gambusia affinis TaxID=33528 RepID=A0A315VZB1_GAMAF|nr:hypothetical protein CCH79_00006193 [Gambusia affinis]